MWVHRARNFRSLYWLKQTNKQKTVRQTDTIPESDHHGMIKKKQETKRGKKTTQKRKKVKQSR